MTKLVDLDHFDQALLVADGDSTTEVDTEMLTALVSENERLRARDALTTAVVEAAATCLRAYPWTGWSVPEYKALSAALDALNAGGDTDE